MKCLLFQATNIYIQEYRRGKNLLDRSKVKRTYQRIRERKYMIHIKRKRIYWNILLEKSVRAYAHDSRTKENINGIRIQWRHNNDRKNEMRKWPYVRPVKKARENILLLRCQKKFLNRKYSDGIFTETCCACSLQKSSKGMNPFRVLSTLWTLPMSKIWA